MVQNKNRIVAPSKKVKGAEKGSFGGPSLLYQALRRGAKLYKYSMLLLIFSMVFTGFGITSGGNDALAADKYRNFEDLRANEDPGNYSIFTKDLETPALILAPHGGGIEGGTSELARELSGSYSTYLFEALKVPGASDLHITSTHFDEPQALDMLGRHDLTISLHGYASSEKHTLVGGTDRELAAKMTDALNSGGFSAELLASNAPLAGTNPNNIANRNRTGKSIQLEISTGQRRSMFDKFSITGRAGSKNAEFYQFTNLIAKFVDENVNEMAGDRR
ncbi:poly-gamma-glutamate hydrolase family protein [Bacillus velezensis]|uniref:poly-gamma-glutamate hydrolase family protein n=1 Tax=Bacillus TaxID=1386 RepID=UPI001C529681|nr:MULTISPECIES: poly-gamma-glutamate hydrolase family protein [Bacillus amyloliquefaciens group]QXP99320.1 poly-gamma-glutamate hydrolase family protein [Bacillus velezensis]UHH01336.1 poly-gamma-glutamate hydrolase family protein [Bacillus amyloliquefaciens]ULR21084.1 poly-gamma-glutamate hydrolase family protein [Bacillus velezensis]UVW07827.1 poly-gamma-glutamate hydrolase family protein [Bacillus velezensis]WHL75133.1 poly-gamma-glutamate hydrolase family protein [Bacillus velezensis]